MPKRFIDPFDRKDRYTFLSDLFCNLKELRGVSTREFSRQSGINRSIVTRILKRKIGEIHINIVEKS